MREQQNIPIGYNENVVNEGQIFSGSPEAVPVWDIYLTRPVLKLAVGQSIRNAHEPSGLKRALCAINMTT